MKIENKKIAEITLDAVEREYERKKNINLDLRAEILSIRK